MKEYLQAAIRFTRDELGSEGELRGYALCTDDGLSTLFCNGVLEQELSASDDAELVFKPTDWPRETGGMLDALSDEMYDRYDQTDDVEVHVREMFALLVDALRTAKSEGVFDDQVFLTVLRSLARFSLPTIAAGDLSHQ